MTGTPALRVVWVFVVTILALCVAVVGMYVDGLVPLLVLFLTLVSLALVGTWSSRPWASAASSVNRPALSWGLIWFVAVLAYVQNSYAIGDKEGPVLLLYSIIAGPIAGAAFGGLYSQWPLPEGPLHVLRGLTCGFGAGVYLILVRVAARILSPIHHLVGQVEWLPYVQWVTMGSAASGVFSALALWGLRPSTQAPTP